MMRSILASIILTALLSIVQAHASPVDSARREQASSATNTTINSGMQMPKETFQLPSSLDNELERLLQSWYEGYGKRDTDLSGALRINVAVPNVPDSVYVKMLERIPSAMRMSYNSAVRESIELYLFRRRSLLSSMLTLADLYFPEIETALDKNGLPLELKYLTIVESSLNPSAVSPMGAAGLWQLMLPTARIYGLRISSLVDERMDPSKSTDAACRLLSELYRMYGDWWLALAAYNCGPGNVNRAIKRAGMGAERTFWNIYEYLPRETRRYVPLFIGAYFAMHYHKHYNIQPREVGKPVATEHYTVRQQLTFDKISQLTGVPVEQIKVYNPQFRRGIIPGNSEPYPIRLPVKAAMTLEGLAPDSIRSIELAINQDSPRSRSAERKVEEASGEENEEVATITPSRKAKAQYHKVRRGETLSSIARKYSTSAKALKRINGIKNDKLRKGQRLRVK